MYRLDENIIRYLTIVLDARALEYLEEMKENESEDNSEEETKTADTTKDESSKDKKDTEE